MRWLLTPIRGLGVAGAAANARAELEASYVHRLQVDLVLRRVNGPRPAGAPLAPAGGARAA